MAFSFEKIKQSLAEEPKYRLKQAIDAIYKQGIVSWSELSVFPKDLRERLEGECPLGMDASIKESGTKNSVKAVMGVEGGYIETVLMRHQGRNTVCVSTQLGCSLACRFCLTGSLGLSRNLSINEMLDQVLFFKRYLRPMGERVSSVVFMGMGEPFNNYDNLLSAIAKLNDPDLFAIGARHISVSTAGVVPGIRRLSKEKLQVNLSVSLHAASDELRDELMPINKAYPLAKLLEAIALYINKTKRRVMIEYIMLGGVNDSPRDADRLARLLKSGLPELFFVNLIKYNDTGSFEASDKHAIEVFKRILSQSGISVVERYRFGQDIKGACGQLGKRMDGQLLSDFR